MKAHIVLRLMPFIISEFSRKIFSFYLSLSLSLSLFLSISLSLSPSLSLSLSDILPDIANILPASTVLVNPISYYVMDIYYIDVTKCSRKLLSNLFDLAPLYHCLSC
eukprot:sb/3477689/